MIAYLQGALAFKSPTKVYLDCAGVGYELHISLNTYSMIEKLDKVKLYTHLHIKEDAHTLYGFFDLAEKEIFQLLISVSGVGPNTARIIVSSMEVDDVKRAIVQEDVPTFNRVKGIGPKTAKRIILDLKDKVIKSVDENMVSSISQGNTNRNEALSALLALGFQRQTIDKILNKIIREHPEMDTVEELIKVSLKELS